MCPRLMMGKAGAEAAGRVRRDNKNMSMQGQLHAPVDPLDLVCGLAVSGAGT